MTGVARNDSIILETFRHVHVRERFLVAFGVGINVQSGSTSSLIAYIHHLWNDGKPLLATNALRNVGGRQILPARGYLRARYGRITVLVPIELGTIRCLVGTDAASTGNAEAVRIALVIVSTATTGGLATGVL